MNGTMQNCLWITPLGIVMCPEKKTANGRVQNRTRMFFGRRKLGVAFVGKWLRSMLLTEQITNVHSFKWWPQIITIDFGDMRKWFEKCSPIISGCFFIEFTSLTRADKWNYAHLRRWYSFRPQFPRMDELYYRTWIYMILQSDGWVCWATKLTTEVRVILTIWVLSFVTGCYNFTIFWFFFHRHSVLRGYNQDLISVLNV